MENEQTTLRDTLSQAFDEHVPEPEKVEEQPKQEGKTAGRPRDEKGRLLPGKAEEKAEPKVEAKTEAKVEPKIEVQSEKAEPSRPPRPSTWKKDYWDHWEKLDPKLAEYIHQRESEYAKGVSTYKTEYDRVKPIADTLAPYQPFLKQQNIEPEKFVSALLQTDQILRYGSPQQKLQHFVGLSQLYQLPLNELFVQGEDGKVYFNQQHFGNAQPAQQQGISPQEVEKLIQQRVSDMHWMNEINRFKEAKDADGNPSHPHFEALRQSMHGLLQSGLAKDLPSAYEGALRLPQHADLFEAQQTAKRKTEEDAKLKAKTEQAARARRDAVSVKGQSPTGEVTKQTGRKGLRDSITDAFEQIESGRV